MDTGIGWCLLVSAGFAVLCWFCAGLSPDAAAQAIVATSVVRVLAQAMVARLFVFAPVHWPRHHHDKNRGNTVGSVRMQCTVPQTGT